MTGPRGQMVNWGEEGGRRREREDGRYHSQMRGHEIIKGQ